MGVPMIWNDSIFGGPVAVPVVTAPVTAPFITGPIAISIEEKDGGGSSRSGVERAGPEEFEDAEEGVEAGAGKKGGRGTEAEAVAGPSKVLTEDVRTEVVREPGSGKRKRGYSSKEFVGSESDAYAPTPEEILPPKKKAKSGKKTKATTPAPSSTTAATRASSRKPRLGSVPLTNREPSPKPGIYWLNVEEIVPGGSCAPCKRRGSPCLVSYLDMGSPEIQAKVGKSKKGETRRRPYAKASCNACVVGHSNCQWGALFQPCGDARHQHIPECEAPSAPDEEAQRMTALAIQATKGGDSGEDVEMRNPEPQMGVAQLTLDTATRGKRRRKPSSRATGAEGPSKRGRLDTVAEEEPSQTESKKTESAKVARVDELRSEGVKSRPSTSSPAPVAPQQPSGGDRANTGPSKTPTPAPSKNGTRISIPGRRPKAQALTMPSTVAATLRADRKEAESRPRQSPVAPNNTSEVGGKYSTPLPSPVAPTPIAPTPRADPNAGEAKPRTSTVAPNTTAEVGPREVRCK